MDKAFTLIEILVVIVIIAVLSSIILFSVTQYINKGKDSNIAGNLVILIPAGEVYYNGNSNSYAGFCDPNTNSVLKNAISQMPVNSDPACAGNSAGICCAVNGNGDQWAACAKKFSNANAFCVDSRGMKEDNMPAGSCVAGLTQCP